MTRTALTARMEKAMRKSRTMNGFLEPSKRLKAAPVLRTWVMRKT